MALREDSGKRKSMSDSLFRTTIHHMKVMNHFSKDLQKLQISFGGALQKLQKEERAKGGVLDMDTKIVSSITSHDAEIYR